jgi:hypothetical protein
MSQVSQILIITDDSNDLNDIPCPQCVQRHEQLKDPVQKQIRSFQQLSLAGCTLPKR